MRKARRGWTMPEEDARSMLTMIEERIRSSDIQVEHRDVLIRLREMIEDELWALERQPGPPRGSSLEPTNQS
jgi:hypothetical protein